VDDEPMALDSEDPSEDENPARLKLFHRLPRYQPG
jgi:hypothetical protein